MVKKTKELISKQATVIAKRADEHEDFITKVASFESSCIAVHCPMLEISFVLVCRLLVILCCS